MDRVHYRDRDRYRNRDQNKMTIGHEEPDVYQLSMGYVA